MMLWVAIRRCGCWQAAMVDGRHFRDVDQFKTTSEASGCTVERVTDAEFRERFVAAPACVHVDGARRDA
jgi:hypothetical protein